MKRLFTLFAAALLAIGANAQCPECVPDESCIPDVPFPTLCPEILPDATAGEYYESIVTFYLPPELEDPGSGLIVTLNEILITNVSGLPFGLSFELDEEDFTYNPSQGQQFGCATTCGTPILPGNYTLTVFVTATVTVFGLEQSVDQSFQAPLTVLEGENTLASFTYDNLASCDTLEVTFNALIDGAPSPTAYSWDFGNGQTSDQANPPVQLYTASGEYTVTLQTDVTYYILTSVSMTSLNDNWLGDIEELTTLSNPDPYFVLTNGDGIVVYTSSTIDGSLTPNWSNINIILDNPPYSITLWDEDSISNDDNLGTASLPFAEGVANFNANGSSGLAVIGTTPGPSFYDELVVSVLPSPDPVFTIDEETNTLSYDDPELDVFTWFLNGDTIQGQNTSSLIAEAPGVYSCSVQNIYGCSGTSQTWTLCPEVVITQNGDVLSVPAGFESYQWSYNGLDVEGATGPELDFIGLGNYQVEITTDYGCEVESEVLSITVGIGEMSAGFELNTYPNPAQDVLNITIDGASGRLQTLEIYDLSGRLVMNRGFNNSGMTQSIDVSGLTAGQYLLLVRSSLGAARGRFSVIR